MEDFRHVAREMEVLQGRLSRATRRRGAEAHRMWILGPPKMCSVLCGDVQLQKGYPRKFKNNILKRGCGRLSSKGLLQFHKWQVGPQNCQVAKTLSQASEKGCNVGIWGEREAFVWGPGIWGVTWIVHSLKCRPPANIKGSSLRTRSV